MSVEYELEERSGFIHIRARGVLTSKGQAIDFFKSMNHDLKGRNSLRVLVDNREVEGVSLSFFDKYDFVSAFSDDMESRKVRWAMVVNTDRRRSLEDLETLVRNRGYAFLGFESVEKAEAWLHE